MCSSDLAFVVLVLPSLLILPVKLLAVWLVAEGRVTLGVAVIVAAKVVGTALLAWLLETRVVVWTPSFIVAMLWLTLVLSVGTISLLYLLIRRGAVSKIASLFFLVPPATALTAWVMFGETLGPLALGGVALTAVGVFLVQRA